jgi:outer membrane protein assembly factor BamE (lipoprotein component of BamABCDE complex)
MVHTSRTIRIGVGVIALALLSTGCSRVRGHQGFIVDNQLVEAIQPGVDNRDSVQKTLGRPTFVGQFDQNDWFYVARNTKQLAFANPRATDQVILRVRFDPAGNVASVDKRGTEQIARISPNGDKTPTLGKERGFLEDLFGNIGQVGAAGGAAGQGGTADNPN